MRTRRRLMMPQQPHTFTRSVERVATRYMVLRCYMLQPGDASVKRYARDAFIDAARPRAARRCQRVRQSVRARDNRQHGVYTAARVTGAVAALLLLLLRDGLRRLPVIIVRVKMR